MVLQASQDLFKEHAGWAARPPPGRATCGDQPEELTSS